MNGIFSIGMRHPPPAVRWRPGKIRYAYDCSKATQHVVDVVTDVGVAKYTVPASKTDVERSPQRERWLEADRQALNVILAGPGNCLVPVSEPESIGEPVARTVSPSRPARKLKVDQATGRLAAKDAYKSRHAVDGGFLKVQRARAGVAPQDVPTSATMADRGHALYLA